MLTFALYYGLSLSGLAVVLAEQNRAGLGRRHVLAGALAGIGVVCVLGAVLAVLPVAAGLPLSLGGVALGLAWVASRMERPAGPRPRRHHDLMRLSNL